MVEIDYLLKSTASTTANGMPRGMPDELEKSFIDFTWRARDALSQASKTVTRGALRVVPGLAMLPEIVASLEDGTEFSALVEETKRIYRGTRHGKSGWKDAVGNWFRRSCVYERLAAGDIPNHTIVFQSYRDAFSGDQTQVTHLAPIEYVSFRKDLMDFGPFQICWMSKEGLEDRLQNRTKALFYKWAQVPTDELWGYWWLIAEEKEPTPPIGKIVVNFRALSYVRRSYTPHPETIELALQALVLYPWLPDWAEVDGSSTERFPLFEGWSGFAIPFVLRVDDGLRKPPYGPIANVRMLEREPNFDPDTGEEQGDRPTIHFHLDESKTSAFEVFVGAESERLTRLRNLKWSKDLIDVALGFLVKGFFANEVEQLLWHITTIEALFGEDGSDLTERLAQRVSRVLGSTDAERKEIRKRFKELYNTRSELVHGTPTPSDVQARHLRTAREFARSVALWFVHWIDEIVSKAAGDPARLPDRRDLLRFLDLKPDSRSHIKWLAESMPQDFPRIVSWL